MGFFKAMLSENGEPSSKRFVGFISYLVALGCIIGLTIKDGATTVVEDLIQTLLITASGLLGIASVTSIWKNGSSSVGEKPKDKEDTLLDEEVD